MRSLLRTACLLLFTCSLHAQVRLPSYTTETLANGVTVYFMPRPGVPLVQIDVAIRGGKEAEPASRPGMAGIVSDLLRKGNAAGSAEQFSLALDALGASYRTRSDEQSTLIESEFLAKDFSAGLSLIAQAVLTPTFPVPEVAKLLAQRRDGIKALKDDPAQAISPYAHAFFFGDEHPYGRVIDEQAVASFTRSDIVAWYRRMYCGKNLIVAVLGDVDAAVVKRGVERWFGMASAGEPYQWTAPIELPENSENRLLLVDKPAATQTYFYISQPGIAASNPDRVTINLVNTLFGGRFTSMINEELRVKSGLSYGARNIIDLDRLQGMNSISTYTKTDATAQALTLSIETLKRLGEQGISADQLASVKAYIKGRFPTQSLETADQLARQLIRLDVLGLGRDEVDRLYDRIDAVTLDQANAVAKKYFRVAGLTFVLIGDAKKVRPQLAKLGMSGKELSISSPGFGSGVRGAPTRATPKR